MLTMSDGYPIFKFSVLIFSEPSLELNFYSLLSAITVGNLGMNPKGGFIILKAAGFKMSKDDLQRNGTQALKMMLAKRTNNTYTDVWKCKHS